MEKFISYEKLSKKKKREHDQVQRSTWGTINPVTRKTENAKAYSRKKSRRSIDEYPNGGAFCIIPHFIV